MVIAPPSVPLAVVLSTLVVHHTSLRAIVVVQVVVATAAADIAVVVVDTEATAAVAHKVAAAVLNPADQAIQPVDKKKAVDLRVCGFLVQ